VNGTILFDGVCNLCNGFVQFVIARDPHARFRFAALSSDAAKKLLENSSVRESIPDSMVLVQDGKVYFRSDAPLRIARGLTFPWPLLTAWSSSHVASATGCMTSSPRGAIAGSGVATCAWSRHPSCANAFWTL